MLKTLFQFGMQPYKRKINLFKCALFLLIFENEQQYLYKIRLNILKPEVFQLLPKFNIFILQYKTKTTKTKSYMNTYIS